MKNDKNQLTDRRGDPTGRPLTAQSTWLVIASNPKMLVGLGAGDPLGRPYDHFVILSSASISAVNHKTVAAKRLKKHTYLVSVF